MIDLMATAEENERRRVDEIDAQCADVLAAAHRNAEHAMTTMRAEVDAQNVYDQLPRVAAYSQFVEMAEGALYAPLDRITVEMKDARGNGMWVHPMERLAPVHRVGPGAVPDESRREVTLDSRKRYLVTVEIREVP